MTDDLFILAWKRGIQKVGIEFFNIKAPCLDLATEKWQLEPNYEFIENVMENYSYAKQVLIRLMYSMFDPEYGLKLLEESHNTNLVLTPSILDNETRDIITQLWIHNKGW